MLAMASVIEYSTIADEALMLRYAGGDMQAFDVLYTRHEMGVWRYVFRSVRIQAVADDLLQDVWFALARQAPNYQPTAKFKTWLFTLAHNRLVDHFRTHRQHESLDADDNDAQAKDQSLNATLAANSGFGPLRKLESKEQALALIEAIEQLPQDQKEAFLMQGRSRTECARHRQRPLGSALKPPKAALRYARSRLRELLREYA